MGYKMPTETVHGEKLDTLEKIIVYHLEDSHSCNNCKRCKSTVKYPGGVCTMEECEYDCNGRFFEPSKEFIDEIINDIQHLTKGQPNI